MKVLITGGCGFLGSNIAASFLELGEEVVVIDALFRNGGSANLEWLQSIARESQFKFHRLDLAVDALVREVFKREGPFDYICHLGGQVAMTTSLEDPRRDLLTNVIGTFNILEAVREYCPDCLVAYSSTNKVYGDLIQQSYIEEGKRYRVEGSPNGFDESLALDFASPYGCSKGAADQYVRDWHRNFDLRTVVFRHSSIYGGRQFSTFDQGWVGWFCLKAIEQNNAILAGQTVQPFTIQGSGKQVRDVLHVNDLIRLYQTAYQHRDSVSGSIYNIGGGISNSLSLMELFDLLEELLDMSAPLEFNRSERRKSDQNFFVADINKANNELGWFPQVDCRSGVSHMLEWTKSMSSTS